MARFKTRARTVDMLGRQQIANASTAISELFKNAYDADAQHAEVDFFRRDRLLIIRDDGRGMTPKEFEENWLVLGTENKLTQKINREEDGPGKNIRRRAIMGEKGIGRLAIALLGKQVLILSRTNQKKFNNDLVMCYIHWKLFEIPGLNIDQIEIPVFTISGKKLPTDQDVKLITKQVSAHVTKLLENHDGEACKKIIEDISKFNVDPCDINDFLGGLSIGNDQSGTHFYICRAADDILNDIEREINEKTKDFSKFIRGFTNSVFRQKPPPPIHTAFRYWPNDNHNIDLISEGEFFTPAELNAADHRISGRIDEYGQFKGYVRVYENETNEHVINWKFGNDKKTYCGPFEIELCYVMGSQRESKMLPDDWVRIKEKLDRIGGVYVYKDRIRILPYGNSDVDWLNIEERRTKGAAYYFFSHRRIFGAVLLSHRDNAKLREKAGREGFQQDKAYRELQEILQNLLIQLASDFFRETGNYSNHFLEKRSEYNRLESARKEQEKRANKARRDFASSLNLFFDNVNTETPKKEMHQLREMIFLQMNKALKTNGKDDILHRITDLESRGIEQLYNIFEKYQVEKPRGIGLPEQLSRDWHAYNLELKAISQELVEPIKAEINQMRRDIEGKLGIESDKTKTLIGNLQHRAQMRKEILDREVEKTLNLANKMNFAIQESCKKSMLRIDDIISRSENDLGEDIGNDFDSEMIEKRIIKYESNFETIFQTFRSSFSKIQDIMQTLIDNISQESEVLDIDILEAMDQELQELRQQTDINAELVQLGLAVYVINHELETAIGSVRRSLRQLRPWMKENVEFRNAYLNIVNNFEHLDAQLNLFTPLQRRLYRKKIHVSGSEIYHYILNVFDARLNRNKINLDATEYFLNSSVLSYPSTLYPVFVNLVDNAIFWLKDISRNRQIWLDADDSGYLISNNGPAIDKRDIEVVFEQGFTRKPGGRGLGLYIAREILQKENMQIDIIPESDVEGVVFKVFWPR